MSIALFTAGLATFALLYSTQPLLPELSQVFGVSPGQAALSMSAATLGLGVALLLAGPAGEVWGRTPLMKASLAVSSVAGLVCALSPTWPALLGLRVLQGLTLAGLPSVAVAYLREEVAQEAQGRAVGLYVGATGIGAMTGRLIVGGIADVAGWRWAIAGVAVLGLGCALVVHRTLPASRNFRPAPASAAQIWATSRRLLTDPALRALYVIGGCSLGGMIAMYNAMGFRLALPPYELSLAVAGLIYLTYALGLPASAYAGRQADRRGFRAVMPLAALVPIAGALLTVATPWVPLLLGLACFTAGFFAVHGLASGWVAARASLGGGGTGQAASIYLFSYYLGSSVFGGLGGLAWALGGWPPVVLLVVGLYGIVLALALRLRRIPSFKEPPAPDPGLAGY